MSEPTEPSPQTETCPRGHVVPTSEIVIRDGHKVCPRCEEQSVTWAAAPTRFWSRHQLRIPLVVAAAALFVWGVASIFGIAADASFLGHDYLGATPRLVDSIFATLALFALAAATAWIAYLVGLEERRR